MQTHLFFTAIAIPCGTFLSTACIVRKGKIHIGTSGWSYRHWKGKFYPDSLAAAAEFGYYCSIFKTVELNNSFYRIPDPETLHGPGAKYQGSYPAETLQEWASRCVSWQRAGKDV